MPQDERMTLTLKDMPKHGIPKRRLVGDWELTGEMRTHKTDGSHISRWNKKGEHYSEGKEKE